jgi:uncharacterized protein (UPF0333 family)
MSGLLQTTSTTSSESSILRPVLVGVVLVAIVVGLFTLVFRTERKKPVAPPAYAANLHFSDLKVSAAQNFVGATVTYLDGTLTNSGDKTVTHAVVQIIFKDDMGQMAQREEVPVRVLRSSSYDEAVDLNMSPLAPGQNKPFRLTFESISAQWNRAYPDMQITQVSLK